MNVRLIPLVVLAACGEVQAPVTVDAAIDAPPVPLPRNASGHQLSPKLLDINATIATSAELVVVGATRDMPADLKDGFIARLGGTTETAVFVGGASNDQLYAATTHGTDLAAVGLTRSFRGTLLQDQAMLVLNDGVSAVYTVRRYYLAADEAIQMRTASPNGAGWMFGGPHLAGARGFVALTAADGTVQRAVSFLAGPVASEVRVRRVLGDGARVYAIGRATQGAVAAGYVVAFDAATLAVLWARRVTSSGNVELLDGALDGTTLRVVGSLDQSGVSIDLDTVTGTATTPQRWPNHQLQSIAKVGSDWFIAGRVGANALAGILESDELRGATFGDLLLPSISPYALATSLDRATLVGSRAGGFIEIPLNTTPVGACTNTALGAPTTATPEAAPITVELAVVDSEAMPLLSAVATGATITAAPLSPLDPCTF